MARFDYDVLVIGSGFGGSIAAMRATEKGYSVGVLEAGRRFLDADIPTTSWDVRKFVWQPEVELFGMQRIEYLEDVLVLSGAGVGGGSNTYANTLYVPPVHVWDNPLVSGLADWATELSPHFDQAQRMLGVVRGPYMDSDSDRLIREVAVDMGRPEFFSRPPMGIYFGTPGVEVDDPYFGGVGPARTGCISCSNCMIGCGHGAKNKTTENYLFLAEKFGADVYDFTEARSIDPLPDGGYRVTTYHPGLKRLLGRDKHFTAEHVIVSAHAYGTAKLLHHMKHKGALPDLSDRIGRYARTNSESLLSIFRTHKEWAEHPERFHITPAAASVTGAIAPDDNSLLGPVKYGVGSDIMALLYTYHYEGEDEEHLRGWLKHLMHHPQETLGIDDARDWAQRAFNLLCMEDLDNHIDLYWDDGRMRSKHDPGQEMPAVQPIVNETAHRLAEKLGGNVAGEVFEVAGRSASAHFMGGMLAGDNADTGVTDPFQRVFNYPGLHVMDGSNIPVNLGRNPSLTIAAMTERAMSFWPNKGDDDPRAPLGSSYEPIPGVMPHAPIVPAGAPGELRWDVTDAHDPPVLKGQGSI
ncbi:GMC oxidoreductase [Ilumatobacter sp.]|uniref:GMC oxidoreductase n=1 Tax=Ilumatobacter sp. TaxID=1967498 RepID=UPI003C449A55